MFDKMYMVKVFTKEHIMYMYHNMFTISTAVHGYSLKYTCKLAGNYKLYSTGNQIPVYFSWTKKRYILSVDITHLAVPDHSALVDSDFLITVFLQCHLPSDSIYSVLSLNHNGNNYLNDSNFNDYYYPIFYWSLHRLDWRSTSLWNLCAPLML